MADREYAELAEAVHGAVLEPGDEEYQDGREVWNMRYDRRPDVIARCESATDVQAAVNFARDQELLLSVKGGGHAYAANTVGDGGLLIDLSPMKGIQVHPEARTARVEPGVTWGELDAATQDHGLATTGGTVSSIGVSGLTLGGGTGYLVRKHGMTIDNLLSAEVVTADGEKVRASADENSDLFWALRGGGGNFGVITSLEYQLHSLGPQVLAGQIVHPIDEAGELLRLYRRFMAEAPEDIQCYAFVLRIPPIPDFPEETHGKVAIDLILFHTDPNGETAFEPLLNFGDPILSFAAPQPYTAVQQSFDAGLPAGQRYESRAHYLDGISDEVIEIFTTHASELPGEFTIVYFEPLGGAAGRVERSATAFAHREAAYSLHILAGWADPELDETAVAWADRFHGAMAPHATGGVYVNLLGADEEARVRAAYGDNYERLVELKGKWDPDNLFRMNHNIPPA